MGFRWLAVLAAVKAQFRLLLRCEELAQLTLDALPEDDIAFE